MKEWSDEELDKLFQKSVEEHSPPYEPADWQDLRRRLDEVDGINPKGGMLKKALPWLALGLLLVLGGLSLYYGIGEKSADAVSSVAGIRPADHESGQVPQAAPAGLPLVFPIGGAREQKPQDRKVVERSPHSQVAKSPKASEENDINDLKELPRNLASVSGVRKQSNRSDQERGDGAILLPPSTSKKTVEVPFASVRPGSQQEVPDAIGRSDLEAAKGVPFIPLPQQMAGREEQTATVADRESEVQRMSRMEWLPAETLATRRNYQQSNPLPFPGITSPYSSTGPLVSNSSRALATQSPKWSIRLGISPDLSVVRMSDMMQSMRPGPSASLLVERSISDKWTFQTGIIRSLKNYSMSFSEYHPAEDMNQTTMPVTVDGKNTVFEVPLNVRFDFSQRPRTRWFAGAGISSYKMQKENYTYHYDTYVANGEKGWWGSTGWYLLSHANASVGYERRITERLSLVAEPYLRIPLRGVGFGKVNIFTGGVWFSMRYTPVFRK